MKVTTFSEFIKAEIAKRHMSAREFAKLCGIAPASISAYVNDAEVDPTLSTLKKLSRCTGADLETLIDLAFPGELHTSYPSEVMLLARELADLRRNHKQIYDFVVSFVRAQAGANNGKK